MGNDYHRLISRAIADLAQAPGRNRQDFYDRLRETLGEEPSSEEDPRIATAALERAIDRIEEKADSKEVLWRLYEDNREYAKFHEKGRAIITNHIATVAAILIGLITFDGKLTLSDLPISIFIIVLGCFGAAISSKQYERSRLHLTRGYRYLDALNKLYRIDLLEPKRLADEEHQKRFQFLSSIHLNRFWTVVHVFLATLGLILSVMIAWPAITERFFHG